jgi:hypothetical protein
MGAERAGELYVRCGLPLNLKIAVIEALRVSINIFTTGTRDEEAAWR